MLFIKINAIDNNATEELLHIGFDILTIPIAISICGSMIFYIVEFLYSQS